MSKEFYSITEVVELFEVEEGFLTELEDEEIICSFCPEDSPNKLFSTSELEKLRLVKILIEDMGVNLEGVEIILRMRQRMIEMRRQFDDILEDLGQQIRGSFKGGS